MDLLKARKTLNPRNSLRRLVRLESETTKLSTLQKRQRSPSGFQLTQAALLRMLWYSSTETFWVTLNIFQRWYRATSSMRFCRKKTGSKAQQRSGQPFAHLSISSYLLETSPLRLHYKPFLRALASITSRSTSRRDPTSCLNYQGYLSAKTTCLSVAISSQLLRLKHFIALVSWRPSYRSQPRRRHLISG